MNWADIQHSLEGGKYDNFADDDQYSTIKWISQFPREKTIMVEMTTAFSLDVWILLIFSTLVMLLLFHVANKLFWINGFQPVETDYFEMLPFT